MTWNDVLSRLGETEETHAKPNYTFMFSHFHFNLIPNKKQ